MTAAQSKLGTKINPVKVSPEIAAIARRAVKALRTGRRNYGLHDELVAELLGLVKIGEWFRVSKKRSMRLVDQFAERNVAFKSTSFKRYDLEVRSK